jgi:hypothetical protein
VKHGSNQHKKVDREISRSSKQPNPVAGGVHQYIKDKAVLSWLGKAAQRYNVPPAKQAQLAALLIN